MGDISDTIQEAAERARESKLNARVAIWVAITATIMAICDVKDGNVTQAMELAQANRIDAWSYFQAKSTKQAIVQNSMELLKLQKPPGYEELVKKDEEEIARYKTEKADLETKAD